MVAITKPIHDYDDPPLREVVLGVQYFEEIPGFTSAHIGKWATEVGGLHIQGETQLLKPAIEKKTGTLTPIRFNLGVPPARRTRLSDESGQWLVQLQPDRFLLNWVKQSEDYPRFGDVFARYRELRNSFEGFARQHFGPLPKPNQYELTYLNVVPPDGIWSDLLQAGKVFPNLDWKQAEPLAAPEEVSWNASFPMTDDLGRLHVKLLARPKEIVAEFIARGSGPDPLDDEGWFCEARELIVRSFSQLTTEDAKNKVWRIK